MKTRTGLAGSLGSKKKKFLPIIREAIKKLAIDKGVTITDLYKYARNKIDCDTGKIKTGLLAALKTGVDTGILIKQDRYRYGLKRKRISADEIVGLCGKCGGKMKKRRRSKSRCKKRRKSRCRRKSRSRRRKSRCRKRRSKCRRRSKPRRRRSKCRRKSRPKKRSCRKKRRSCKSRMKRHPSLFEIPADQIAQKHSHQVQNP